jgi:hypothetical protein
MKFKFIQISLISTIIIFSNNYLKGQVNIKDSSIAMSIVSVHYSAQLPGGDLAQRFGWNSNLGLSYEYKTKSNCLYGMEASYIFGGAPIEQDIMSNLITPQGNIIGSNGEYGNVVLYERGLIMMANYGKMFYAKGPNPNSGFYILGGAGFLQTQIFIEDISKNVPEIDGDYSKGYDRLTNGPALSQTLGYMYFSNKHFFNFFINVEFIEAMTQERRAFNFDTMQADHKTRSDILYGITAGWSLPLYRRAPNAFYYY